MRPKTPTCKDSVLYWKCSKCKKWLEEDDYYSDSRTFNGLKAQCKKCHTKGSIRTRDKENSKRINREYMRRARKRDPNKFRKRERIYSKNRFKNEKIIARQKLNNAVKCGKIIKPKICPECNRKCRITAHHPNYDKPFDVEWKCYECHGNK